MGLPNVNITLDNGALGQTTQTDDGIAGLILTGVAASGLALDTAKQLFSVAEAEAIGIDAAYDTGNSVDVYQQIVDFYAQAGTGAELWLMIVAQTATMTEILDVNGSYAPTLLDAAGGTIRLLAVGRVPDGAYTPVTTDGLDGDVWTAVTKAQALSVAYAADIKPLRVLIAGRAFSGTAGDLLDLNT